MDSAAFGGEIMDKRIIAAAAAVTLTVCSLTAGALACTRFIYETGTDSYIVGRSMDWAEDPAPTSGHSRRASSATAARVRAQSSGHRNMAR